MGALLNNFFLTAVMSLFVAAEPPIVKGHESKHGGMARKDPTLSATKNNNQSDFTVWNLVTIDRGKFHFKQMSG